jgi:formylglycine-generating enzyme required for sulfatase activity
MSLATRRRIIGDGTVFFPCGTSKTLRPLGYFLFFLGLGVLVFAVLFIGRRMATPGPKAGDPSGMVWIPGGEFTMGTDSAWGRPEEKPAHRVRVGGFWMDRTEVTNAQFREFVQATGYRTTAEKAPDVEEIMKQVPAGTPRPSPEALLPGSLVFTPPGKAVPLNDPSNWWTWTPGADWRHPRGPGSTLDGLDAHPVVHVSWEDAREYARWGRKRLPTEAEWEFAARGGLEGRAFVWGDDPRPGGRCMANVWQGRFPVENTVEDGYEFTAPVGSFPPNGYGLVDMAGNVWEWCLDVYDPRAYSRAAGPSLLLDPLVKDCPGAVTLQRAQRGGSFLCSDTFCFRYRPSARQGCAPDTGMSHVGFRCVRSGQADEEGTVREK